MKNTKPLMMSSAVIMGIAGSFYATFAALFAMVMFGNPLKFQSDNTA